MHPPGWGPPFQDSWAADVAILLFQQGRWKGCKEQETDSAFCSRALLASLQEAAPWGLYFNFASPEHCWEEKRLSVPVLFASCFLPPRGGREVGSLVLKEVKLTRLESPMGSGLQWPFCLTSLPWNSALGLNSHPQRRQCQPSAGRQAKGTFCA